MAPFLLAILVVASASPAWAACPQNLVDCYGAAAAFSIVSGKVMLSKGSFGEPGEGGISIDGASAGDTCAPRAFVGGGYGCKTTIDNLILTEPSAVAAKFSTFLCNDYPDYPGFVVPGDIVTGGGTLSGATDMIRVDGVIDTSGLDPRVETCAQALIDMRSASATLAALTPTRDLGVVRTDPNVGGIALIADPGVNVWTAREFSARSKHELFGYVDTTIYIELDPATESVIINTRKVSVGTWSSIYVGGDSSKVVFNLPERGIVKIDASGNIGPAILAPDGKVIVRFDGRVGPVYARRVTVLGGYAY